MKYVTRILAFLFVAFVLVFVGVQVTRVMFQEYTTEVAASYTTAQSIETVGIAVRSEQIISVDKKNVVGYAYEDGSKVAAGSLIAEFYASQTALALRSQLDDIQQEIEMLRDAQKTGLTYLANTEALTEQISSNLYVLLDRGARGDFTYLTDDRLDFLSLMNKKQIATARETDYKFRISELEGEYRQLAASVPTATEQVYMPNTGYFSSVTDGYESVYTPKDLLSATVEQIAGMMSSGTTMPSPVVGKVIHDFNWYFAIVVSAEEANQLSASGTIEATFLTLNESNVPMTVHKIIRQPDADPNDMDASVAVIFRCNHMNAALSGMRVQNVQLSMRSFTGLRVNREAIRFDNGVKGVYARVGNTLQFKSIEDQIVYEQHDFVLVRPSDDSRMLQLYDVIVVKGMDLYDGKPV